MLNNVVKKTLARNAKFDMKKKVGWANVLQEIPMKKINNEEY